LESQHIGFDGNIANVGTDSNSAVAGLAQRFGLSHVFFNNIAQSNVTACVHKRLAKASAHARTTTGYDRHLPRKIFHQVP
jgi:hypothetical protein